MGRQAHTLEELKLRREKVIDLLIHLERHIVELELSQPINPKSRKNLKALRADLLRYECPYCR